MNKIRIGVLGYANIAKRSIIPALGELSADFELVAIGTRDPQKTAAQNPDVKTQFCSYEELLADTTLNAVYNPLPTGLHFEWTKKALEQGLHVLSEKSLTTRFDETKRLVSLAREKNCMLLESFQFQFHSQMASLKSLIKSDKIGHIRCIRASFGFPPFKDADNIRYDKELGGGALLDAGAYTTKISQLLLGTGLTVVHAKLHSAANFEVDIHGTALLEDSSGICAHLAFGFDHSYRCGVEVWGSKGWLSTNRLFTAPPGFEPEIQLESGFDKSVIKLETDDHFQKVLLAFKNLIEHEENRDEHFEEMLDQSRLLEEIADLN